MKYEVLISKPKDLITTGLLLDLDKSLVLVLNDNNVTILHSDISHKESMIVWNFTPEVNDIDDKKITNAIKEYMDSVYHCSFDVKLFEIIKPTFISISQSSFEQECKAEAQRFFKSLRENTSKESIKSFCRKAKFIDSIQEQMDPKQKIILEIVDGEIIWNFRDFTKNFMNRVYIIVKNIATETFISVPQYAKFLDALYFLKSSEEHYDLAMLDKYSQNSEGERDSIKSGDICFAEGWNLLRESDDISIT